jgi:ribosome-binding protein aMBF1 (putative translation factor)
MTDTKNRVGLERTKPTPTDIELFEASSAKNRRLLRQEDLILDVTELLSAAMEDKRITKSELAKRLGKTKGFITQVLSGNRNLTLRTIADIADALGFRVRVRREPLPAATHSSAEVRSRREARNPKVLRYG